jgi:hypothetical protein
MKMRAGISSEYSLPDRSSEEFEQLVAWHKIRDMFFGHHGKTRDLKKALELASACTYRDAVWLTELFAGLELTIFKQARQVFLSQQNDAKALCFAALSGTATLRAELERAASLGDALAKARLIGYA